MDLRRVGLLVIALLVVAGCVRLGIWQLDRLEQRRTANDLVRAGLRSAATPLDDLVGTTPPADLAWRRVVVSGTYDASEEVILYGRTQEGRPGDHVLTPLLLTDGSAVVVDRGWIPFEPDRDLPLSDGSAAPVGTVTVSGLILAPGSGATASEADPSPAVPVSTVQRLDLGVLQRQVPYPLAPVAIQLQGQDPAQRSGSPEPGPLPDLDEGPHLSYAIQWFAFAAIALVGYVLLARRDRRSHERPPDVPGRA